MSLVTRARQAFKRRYRRWVDRRTRVVSVSRLNHRRLYIFPTKAGFAFLALVGAMWLLATNFENNLVFLLSFLLLAFFVVSIHFTHATLSGLTVRPVRAESVFKGEAAAVELCLAQLRARRREQLVLRFAGGDPVMAAVEKSGDTFVTVLAPTSHRGYLEPELLTIDSVYPVGLLRVWTHIRFRFDAVVYPSPIVDRIAVRNRRGKGEGHYEGTSGSEDYVGLKIYEVGESLRHVAWKQYAREQGLWSKQYGDLVDSRVWVDWDTFDGMDTEQRLSRMCWQVCECEASGGVYGVRLPGMEMAPDRGMPHRQKALKRLALHGIDKRTGANDEAS
ncbi:MAG: DUF58 domain-containing protein [Xanthomonadales bacterium]|nr:DUF58 domain-containing protein [Gammaproteobacteria bacterium]NNL04262.1 DUF58 domain-containing protein [Xanthomonadales bacterium]